MKAAKEGRGVSYIDNRGTEYWSENVVGKDEGRKRGGHGVGFWSPRVNGIRHGREKDICAC